MCSRLSTDPLGRKVVIVTTPSAWLLVGQTFVVIDWRLLGFITRGRPPTAKEKTEAKPPYESNSAKRRRRELSEVPDELLDDAAALEAARREQQREPTDLISRAA